MRKRNIQQEIIIILSKWGYEPVSENELLKPDNINCSLLYRKNLYFENLFNIEIFINFTDDSLLSYPEIYISEAQMDKLRARFPHIYNPIPHLEPSKIFYKDNELFSVCYQLHDSNIVPRTNLFMLMNIVETYIRNYFYKIVDQQQYIKEYNEYFIGIINLLVTCTDSSKESWILYSPEENIILDNCSQKLKKILSLKINDNYNPDFTVLTNQKKQLTITDFFNFLRLWDKVAYQHFIKLLKKNKLIYNILISSKNFVFGISFSWIRNETKGLKHIDNKKLLQNPVKFHIVHKYDFKSSILRNLPNEFRQGLFDKKIFQIGLGAIGGYMADALIKIGAGFENDFIIIDNDRLENGNVGRHLLGIEYIGLYKAEAFLKYINRQTLDQAKKIRGLVENIREYSYQYFIQNKIDLIIDATGSIEVQEYVNEMVQDIPLQYRPIILHLWIYGNGECVQGLWVHPKEQQESGGCISCLGSSGTGLYNQYLPVIDADVEQRIGVCSAFTPYAISEGMMATSLGINMLLEWIATGKVQNNYQTRYNSKYSDKKIEDIKLVANPLCPMCGEKNV